MVGEPETVEVSEGIYAYIQPDGSWYINNTGFITGGGGVISIDTCSTQRRTQAYLDAVAAVTGPPIRTLLNTHHHGDHTYGNCLLPGATIVGHDRCRAEVLAGGPPANLGVWTDVEWGDLTVAPPFLTYDSGVTLWAGDLRCDVRYVGTPAHTTNDSIVHIPDRSVLFAGDLVFNGGTPFLLMGSIAGAIEVLTGVLRPLGARVIVPGHGPVCGPEGSTRCSDTCVSSRTSPGEAGSRACPRWTPRGRPTSASTRAGLIPNGSWETCIAATRSSTGPSGGSPST